MMPVRHCPNLLLKYMTVPSMRCAFRGTSNVKKAAHVRTGYVSRERAHIDRSTTLHIGRSQYAAPAQAHDEKIARLADG